MNDYLSTSRTCLLILVAGFFVFTGVSAPAYGQQATATTDGYAIKITLSLLGTSTSLTVNPTPHVSESAVSAAFSDSPADVSLNQSVGSVLTANAGVLSAATQFASPSAPGDFMVVGTLAGATDVDIGAIGGASSAKLLDLHVNALTSQALVSGYCPATPAPAFGAMTTAASPIDSMIFANGFDPLNLQATAFTSGYGNYTPPGGGGSQPGITLSLAGGNVVTLPTNPSPNTNVSIGLAGLVTGTLILNEQTSSGDGIHSAGMTANALNLDLHVGLGGVLNILSANVVIAHSQASLSCP